MEERVTLKQLIMKYNNDEATFGFMYYPNSMYNDTNLIHFVDKCSTGIFDTEFYLDFEELDETEKNELVKMVLYYDLHLGLYVTSNYNETQLHNISSLGERFKEISESLAKPPVFK